MLAAASATFCRYGTRRPSMGRYGSRAFCRLAIGDDDQNRYASPSSFASRSTARAEEEVAFASGVEERRARLHAALEAIGFDEFEPLTTDPAFRGSAALRMYTSFVCGDCRVRIKRCLQFVHRTPTRTAILGRVPRVRDPGIGRSQVGRRACDGREASARRQPRCVDQLRGS